MRDERLAVLGLFLLAGLAWAAPPALRHLQELRRSTVPLTIYPEAPAGTLAWSPAPVAPQPAAASPAPLPGGWQGLLLGQPLDLNAATLEDLQALPRVGPKTAAAILALRAERGRFAAVEDLLAVRGIGSKTLEQLRPLVRVQSR